jgi:hypothetical protein
VNRVVTRLVTGDRRYRPTLTRALILSPDPLVAALVGVVVDLAGCEPVFPIGAESPQDALRATRPAHVLVDCEDRAASDDSLLGNAMMMGARLFLFGTDAGIAATRMLSSRYQGGCITIPRDVERLPTLLVTGVNESTPRPPRSTAR